MTTPLLQIDDLSVKFSTPDGTVSAVNGLSFDLDVGETLAIVGESGSGKTQLAFATLGLLARNGRAEGSVRFEGREILNLPEEKLNAIRAEKISMIFQDPMTSLNPFMRVGDQMAEVLQLHKGLSKRRALDESAKMLDAVRIPDAKSRLRMYPHEFSGGMRQRIMIAMSLLCKPKLLIADEPTTALDVTVQAQIMALMADIQRDFGAAIILITHDLGIVAGACERTLVMYGGQVGEQGPVRELFANPKHPYTRALLETVPHVRGARAERLKVIQGQPPMLSGQPTACPFRDRCPEAMPRCAQENPWRISVGHSHDVACFWDPDTGEARDV